MVECCGPSDCEPELCCTSWPATGLGSRRLGHDSSVDRVQLVSVYTCPSTFGKPGLKRDFHSGRFRVGCGLTRGSREPRNGAASAGHVADSRNRHTTTTAMDSVGFDLGYYHGCTQKSFVEANAVVSDLIRFSFNSQGPKLIHRARTMLAP